MIGDTSLPESFPPSNQMSKLEIKKFNSIENTTKDKEDDMPFEVDESGLTPRKKIFN